MSFKIVRLDFSKEAVVDWKAEDEKHNDWPVVYVLDDGQPIRRARSGGQMKHIYVGETRNAAKRMHEHLRTPAKQHLLNIRVILHERFNKSVCWDLESYLIKMLAGDGAYQMLNRNDGIVNAQYFDRAVYREEFRRIFEILREDGIFTQSIAEIENSDLYKLSPFKSLTMDQADSVEAIVNDLLSDIARNNESSIVIQGDPGTGKTVVAIYLMKLLADMKAFDDFEDLDNDSRFASFFTAANYTILRSFRMAMVVPQQSLRHTVRAVFKKTRGLHENMVKSAFEIGEAEDDFDLLLIDETHRLSQRASLTNNAKFPAINARLWGADDLTKSQLDWIEKKSRHQIFLLDAEQSVRPADLPSTVLSNLVATARANGRHFQLQTQMRVRAGTDYVSYVRWFLHASPQRVPPVRLHLGEYDFRMFDSLTDMRNEIFQRDAEFGLARVVAGFAWPWPSKKKKDAFDINIEGLSLRWNVKDTDWISSPTSLQEVGSIHTVQGYDLNYVGVLIGLDLRFDQETKRLCIDRKTYSDRKGKEDNHIVGIKYSDDDLLRFITQIYGVLLTRGIRGTYVYACDPGLREYLRGFIPSSSGNPVNSALNPNSFAMDLDI